MRPTQYAMFKQHGIVTDLPPEECAPDVWTGGQNIQFQDHSTRRVGGYVEIFDPLGTIEGVLFAMNVGAGPVNYWIYCTATEIWVTDGFVHYEITPAGGLVATLPGEWDGCILNGVPCLNSPRNAPMYWNLSTSTMAAVLPGWPAGALTFCLRAHKYHLIAIGIVDGGEVYPNTLWWSGGAAPGSVPPVWVPGPDNDAGDMVLGDTPGRLIGGGALRDTFCAYKEDSCYVLSYVAGQYVYTNRKLFITAGLISKHSVVEYNGEHWIMTGDDLLRHDGQNFTSLVQEKVKQFLVKAINPARTSLSVVVARHQDNQVMFCFASAASDWLDQCIVVDTVTGDCGQRNLPDVAYIARGVVIPAANSDAWNDDPQAWDDDPSFWNQQAYSPTQDSLLMCQPAGADGLPHLLHVDAEDTENGNAVYALVEKRALVLTDGIQRWLVTAVYPRISGEVGEVLQISVGGQEYFEDAVNWSVPFDFVIGQTLMVPAGVTGRLFSLRIEGSTRKRWALFSWKLAYAEQGLY